RPSAPFWPVAPAPPMAWLPAKVQLLSVAAAPCRFTNPPAMPSPDSTPPVLPAPPTAWLLVKVRLLAVQGVPPRKAALAIPPPRPTPIWSPPLPPVLPLPPRASLWSNVLFVIVATPAANTRAPPPPVPILLLSLLGPVALEPPMA